MKVDPPVGIVGAHLFAVAACCIQFASEGAFAVDGGCCFGVVGSEHRSVTKISLTRDEDRSGRKDSRKVPRYLSSIVLLGKGTAMEL